MEANNKLIAEFMGLKEHEGSYYLPLYNSGDWVPDVELEYHSSWDWLMPVLKKINLQLNPDNYNEWRMINKPTEYDIENVHAQAVYFIKNQNN